MAAIRNPSGKNMKLTLLLPGLCWRDAHDGAEVGKGLSVPALQQLLGKGALLRRGESHAECLGRLWGAPATGLARLAAAEAGLDAAQGDWLFADPVHLRVDRDRALLADVGVMKVSQDEAAKLAEALNRHFGEDGLSFHPAQPGRWLLRSDKPLRSSFTPLWDVVGEDINRHLPQGADGLAWCRMLNELQMLLYTQPVNDAREARGELAINSVWLWGEGEPGAWRPPAPACWPTTRRCCRWRAGPACARTPRHSPSTA
ncbi:cofactor-independent phosphoglycerate mutase [Chromobacterium violaceum]|nr:cofactor-independent phosphoglycerate mutase [Chromobacterium violaceum]